MTGSYGERLRAVRENIAQLSREVGRTVMLLAVSKGQPSDKIRELWAEGQRDFGENYVNELLQKAESLKEYEIRWHFIGHLQSNKIRKLVAVCHTIHTVAKLEHGAQIARAAKEAGKVPYPIYVAVNTSGAPQKSGCGRDGVMELIKGLKAFPELMVKGVMAVPAPLGDVGPLEALPEEYEYLKNLTAGKWELSLGMTEDLAQAIRAGSTCVRVGRGLFGPRAS